MADRHCDPEERHQGDRLGPARRLDHLHGEVRLQRRRQRRRTCTRCRCGTRPPASRCSYDPAGEHGMSELMRQLPGGPAQVCPRHHLVPRPLHQLLQALPGRHFCADQGDLEHRQPHRRLPSGAGEGAKSIRVECRIGGGDLNPYLAFAALHRRRARLASTRRSSSRRRSPATPMPASASRGPEDAPRGDAAARPLEDAPRRPRRRRRRPLRPHRGVGTVRVRPPRHRLGTEAGI
jgi:hypothetical protein